MPCSLILYDNFFKLINYWWHETLIYFCSDVLFACYHFFRQTMSSLETTDSIAFKMGCIVWMLPLVESNSYRTNQTSLQLEYVLCMKPTVIALNQSPNGFFHDISIQISFGEHGQYDVVVRLHASLQDESGTGFIHSKWTDTNQGKKNWYTNWFPTDWSLKNNTRHSVFVNPKICAKLDVQRQLKF